MSKFKTLFLIPLVFAGISVSPSVAQQTHYVDELRGNNAFDGSTFTVVSGLKGPLRTIQFAMIKAEPGDRIAVRAGDYTHEGVIATVDKDLTWLIFPDGKKQTVLLDGLIAQHPDRTLVLTNSEQASDGQFLTNGDENDLTLVAGTIHVSGKLVIGEGGSVVRQGGELTGTELITL